MGRGRARLNVCISLCILCARVLFVTEKRGGRVCDVTLSKGRLFTACRFGFTMHLSVS